MSRSTSTVALATALACAACEPASAPEAAPDARPPPAFDAGIEAAYLTQAVQDRAGSVPLVAGRPGLLRVFLRAPSAGVAAPAVRVTLVETSTGAAVRSWIASSPLSTIPTGLFEDARGGSWNVAVPGADVRPGRHVVVDLGPVPGVAPERLRGTVRLPPAGSLDVRPGQRLAVLLVPVIQSGLVPDVDATRTAASWLDLAAAAHPVAGVDVAVGAPFTTDVVLGPDGEGWSELLRDLDRKRVAEGSTRHYLGAVRLAYASGTAGRGLVSGRAALAADAARFYPRIAAHELGHNLGLLHAPCGTSDLASIDPSWPTDPAHEDARIGVSGWDPRTDAIKDPAATWDLMSYCGDEHSTWTSDHGYRRALSGLAGAAVQAQEAAGLAVAPSPGLLVSGRVVDGRVELAPIHAIETAPEGPRGGGWQLDVLSRGTVLATREFEPQGIPEEEGGTRASAHFALAVAIPAGERDRVDAVVVRRHGVEVARRSAPPHAAAAPRALRASDGSVRVEWDPALRPEAMIRRPGTGEVLGFARGGAARLPAGDGPIEVQLSDGVRSDPPLRVRAR